MTLMRSLFWFVLMLAVFGVSAAVAADAPEDPFSRAAMDKNLAEVTKLGQRFSEVLESDEVNQPALLELQSKTGELRKKARDCIDKRKADLDRLVADLAKLGEPVEAEDSAVKEARRRLGDEKTALDQAIASCRLLLVDSEKLLESLTNELTSLKARELFAKFPGVVDIINVVPEELPVLRPLVRHHTGQLGFNQLGTEWRLVLVVVIVAALGLAPVIYLMARQSPDVKPPGSDEFMRSMLFAFLRATTRYGGWLAALILLVGYWALMSWRLGEFLAELGMTLSVLIFLTVIAVGRTFLAPLPPATYYLPFDQATSRRFWWAVRFLALVWTSAAFLYYATFIEWPLVVALHMRFAYTVLFAIALGRVVWVFFELRRRAGYGMVRILVLMVLAAAVVAEFIGYRNLSAFLIQGVMLSVATVTVAWLVSLLNGEFLDSLEEGRYPWQKRFHQWLGIAEDGFLPGVFWMRLLTGLGVWLAAIWALVRIWNVPEAVRADVLAYVTEGFKIGEVTIVPSRIIIAVSLLAVLFSGISWFRKQLDESWLSKSRADVGARNAVSTVAAYIGATLAILLGLSVAGMDLSNLAIIAGALSVGIGFGLQNVVNNFVSGLILLFERPIKKGDWVVVGTTEGYVKKISVRSTQIQTFDNADVIVPNSELISQQVTNWMLYDRKGRVRVPVGVAYGSDVQKVKEILLSIAMAHPQTIVDSRTSKPVVLFIGFGASSLDFELRFFIRNVDNRMTVRSDVNFAIDAAFRENGITIPFPQADVYLHQLPTKVESALSEGGGVEEDGDDGPTDQASPEGSN